MESGAPDCHREALRKEAEALPLSTSAREALRLMGACMTQWRTGFAGATGLDYVAVARAARWADVHLDGPTFNRLRVLEDETLAMWAEEAEKKKGAT